MARSWLAALLLMGIIASASVAADGINGVCTGPDCPNTDGVNQAGSPGSFAHFWHRCHVDFLRNNTWPEPFLSADRMAVRNVYCIQTDNGWKMQNTIGTFLFDRETQRVNEAGDLMVRWILTQAPAHRRVVFVMRGDTAEATNARIQSVQNAVAKYSSGCIYPVLLTDTEPNGWPASYIDAITQHYEATIPNPRLPARQGGGQGGGTGSGGGGGGGVQ